MECLNGEHQTLFGVGRVCSALGGRGRTIARYPNRREGRAAGDVEKWKGTEPSDNSVYNGINS